jgi:poly(A) polymerase
METPQVKAVFQALGAPSVDVRFVGGCVRDSLLGRDIIDIDIATPDAPAVVIEKLETAGLKAVPTGLAHGTVTALAGGQHRAGILPLMRCRSSRTALCLILMTA